LSRHVLQRLSKVDAPTRLDAHLQAGGNLPFADSQLLGDELVARWVEIDGAPGVLICDIQDPW